MDFLPAKTEDFTHLKKVLTVYKVSFVQMGTKL